MDYGLPRVGRLFFNSSLGAGAVSAIVPVTSNAGGIIIRTAQIVAFNAPGVSAAHLYADTSAPPNGTDASRRIVLSANTRGPEYANAELPFPLFIDPGFGLWFATHTSGGGNCIVTYDLVGLAA